MYGTMDVRLAQGGDRDAFGRLAMANERAMYRLSRTMLRCDADCADAIQEAILHAYLNLRVLRDPERFASWLMRILVRECYAILRRQRRTTPQADIELGSAAPDEDMREALASLDISLRVPVVLHYVEGFRLEEIARILNLPQGTVKSRLHRARRKLRLYWEDGGTDREAEHGVSVARDGL